MTDWKNLLPPAPEPMPSREAAPIEAPRVPVAKPEPPKIDNTDPAYWSRKATPAEIRRAEAYRDALERQAEAEERRLRAREQRP